MNLSLFLVLRKSRVSNVILTNVASNALLKQAEKNVPKGAQLAK